MRRTALSVKGFCAGIICLAMVPGAIADDIGETEAQLGEVFHRSMANWNYDYSKMPEVKAGVACVPWERLDAAFLSEGIFEALGFSYSVANDDAAIRIATQGCDQMKAHYKVTDCACETVLIGDAVAIRQPTD